MNGDEAIYCNLMVVFIVVMKNCHVDGNVHVGDSCGQLIDDLGMVTASRMVVIWCNPQD